MATQESPKDKTPKIEASYSHSPHKKGSNIQLPHPRSSRSKKEKPYPTICGHDSLEESNQER